MDLGKLFRRTPMAFATVALLVIMYGIFVAVVVSTTGALTVRDIIFIWPLHLILALNLFAIFGRSKPR